MKLNLHSKITQSYPPSPPLLANLNIPRTTFDIFSGAAHDIQELKCHHVKSWFLKRNWSLNGWISPPTSKIAITLKIEPKWNISMSKKFLFQLIIWYRFSQCLSNSFFIYNLVKFKLHQEYLLPVSMGVYLALLET